MEDDVVAGLWQLDPDTRLGLRLGRVRAAFEAGDWPRVVQEAEELLDEAPEHPEGLGLLASALLELGDTENASDAFADHLSVASPTADALSGLAVARFESCDLHGAEGAAREAIRLDGAFAEAHYTLGLVLERLGRASEATSSFAVAQALDPAAYPFPMVLDDETLQRALVMALHGVSPVVREFWMDVPIRLEEEPRLEELTADAPPLPPTVAGLYAGVPPEEGEEVLTARPDALRLFRKNLARCRSFDEVAEQLVLVLEHEAADWLGDTLDGASR